jgi:hypothetical protein
MDKGCIMEKYCTPDTCWCGLANDTHFWHKTPAHGEKDGKHEEILVYFKFLPN